MAFNKLQGLTLLVTFFVICLLNAKSYDFAEADPAFEAVNELMEGDMTGEAVEQATKKLFGFLPKMKVLNDPKVLGAIAAAVAAVLAGGAMYAVKSRKIADWPKHVKDTMEKRFAKDIDAKLPDEEKNKIKDAREAMKAKITPLIDESDLKKYEEKAEEFLKKAYTAQKELGVKVPEFISMLKNITSNKEAALDSKVQYTKPLVDGAAKPDAKPSDETKAFVASVDAEFSTLVADYTKSLKARKDVDCMLKIISLSDKDLMTVDTNAKPEEMKKGSKK